MYQDATNTRHLSSNFWVLRSLNQENSYFFSFCPSGGATLQRMLYQLPRIDYSGTMLRRFSMLKIPRHHLGDAAVHTLQVHQAVR